MAKYGIKHDNGTIIAITKFDDNILGTGYVELTESDYTRFTKAIDGNPFGTYDAANNEIILDNDALLASQAALNKSSVRSELRRMSVELDLMTRLGEVTTTLQAEFDALKLVYEGL